MMLLHDADALPVHRSARLVIVDPAGRLLLFRYHDEHRPPFWSTAGGRLEPGESYEVAAARELAEETGFAAEVGPPLRVRDEVYAVARDVPARWVEHYFLVRCEGGDPSRDRWTAEERATIREHRWWSAEEMRSTDETFLPSLIPELLEQALAFTRFPERA
jgi:ADP-ribose pyrophosphatase YjhB (NUDIX family)